MSWMPLLLCYLGVAISLVGDSTGHRLSQVLGRSTSSVSALGYAAVGGLLSAPQLGPLLALALLGSACTELLALHPDERAVRWQLWATAVEQLAWSAALYALGTDPIGLLVGAVGGLWLMTLVGDWQRQLPPEHRLGVLAAATMSCTTLAVATGACLGLDATGHPTALGATALLLAGRAAGLYGQIGTPNPLWLGLTLPLGYGGQLLLIWAMLPS
jgi:hypothetical protein